MWYFVHFGHLAHFPLKRQSITETPLHTILIFIVAIISTPPLHSELKHYPQIHIAKGGFAIKKELLEQAEVVSCVVVFL